MHLSQIVRRCAVTSTTGWNQLEKLFAAAALSALYHGHSVMDADTVLRQAVSNPRISSLAAIDRRAETIHYLISSPAISDSAPYFDHRLAG